MTYDPESYWQERGVTYQRDFPHSKMFAAQEQALLAVIEKRFPVEPWRILEVGCGFGRIGKLVMERYPHASYTGVDISSAQIENARKYLPPHADLAVSSIQDLDETLGNLTYDLVLAVEVLMHVPPQDLVMSAAKIRNRGPLITVDWTEPVAKSTNKHNFRHDYERLGFVPQKIIGKQTIFYAD